MLNYRTLFLILSYLFSFTYSYAQYFKKLGVKDGLSCLSVLSIYQDPLGRMWLGTTEGINIYNGNDIYRVTNYSISVGNKCERKNLLGNVQQILGDGKDKIYIRYSDVLLEYSMFNDSFKEIAANRVKTIDFQDGRLFYFVNDSLKQYIPGSSESFICKYNLPEITCMNSKCGKLYVGTRKGLYKIENNSTKCILPDVEIFKLYTSSTNELWVASRLDGLYRIKTDGTIIKETVSPSRVVSSQIREFVEDNQNRIWFGTFDGLQVYDPKIDEYKVYRAGNIAGMLEHESVFSLYKDAQGTIWVGTYYGGVNYFNTDYDLFSFYRSSYGKDGKCLSFPIVGQILEDNDHNLWIATDGGGVNVFDRKTSSFTYINKSIPNSILHDNVKSMAYDYDRDCIYIGTYTGGLSKYDRKTKTFYNYLSHSVKGKSPSDRIHCCRYYNDFLYITATNGFWKLDLRTNEFSVIDYHSDIISMEVDKKENVWLASKNAIYIYNIKTSEFIRLYGFEKKLPKNIRITKILPSKNSNNIYITTLGAGIFSYNIENKGINQYLKSDNELLSNFCYNIAETENGDIFITSDKGISIFTPDSKSLKTIDFKSDKGMISSVADVCGIYASKDGMVYIGGIDGMISINYKEYKKISENIVGGKFYLESMYIDNNLIVPLDKSGILEKVLAYSDEINLKHNQNNISFTFANSNYIGLTRTGTYLYKLEGFDENWISTETTTISYTNIPPGKYNLRIRKVGNKLGETNDDEIKLIINISHPWYANVYAYIVYFIIFISIFYSYWHISFVRQRLALSLENEKREKQQIEEVNKMKLRFFTNVSHELRTPLTLIMGQLEALIQNDKLSIAVQRKLQRIYKNSMNMRNLITELLDFRKQEQGYMKLKVEKYDIILFLQDIYDSFKEYADKRGINYNFYHANQSLDAWFDASQLQKVVFNLLSNAFKYTPANGNISLKIVSLQSMYEIEVKDNGCGISSDSIERIFESFYQVDNVSNNSLIGTGIGLALAKGIIEMHKGHIEVESEIDKGSTFRILLPKGNSHFTEEELNIKGKQPLVNNVISDNVSLSLDDKTDVADNVLSSEENSTKPIMLIVEDDEDILSLLEDMFTSMYSVYNAHNGAEGFDMALKLHPDIIISDVMMPVMSGKEMCYKIKNSLEISHIPVVLLTAQTSEEHTVEGYMFGADDYITKPFNVRVLMSRCNSLVKNRRLIMERQKNLRNEDKNIVIATNIADQQLIDRATEIIKNNLGNPNFDMNVLATELSIGRSKLYARIKEITGITPNEFTLNLKLAEGLKMLKESPEFNISEISYKLGFTSPRYFSKCFKELYGVTPQAFRKEFESKNN